MSAFYFDIRKDVLYCDRPDSARRRAARTVMDEIFRRIVTWFAPILCFTMEEAWIARFRRTGKRASAPVSALPAEWRAPALAAKWARIRDIRRAITLPLEEARRANQIGSSLQAMVRLMLPEQDAGLLSDEEWAEVAIVSQLCSSVNTGGEMSAIIEPAPGERCARCWRVLPEVGHQPGHPTLCARCTDAVASGLVCKVAAE